MCAYAFHRGRRFGMGRRPRLGMLIALLFVLFAIARSVIAVLAETRRELEEIAYYPRGAARPPGNSIIPRENDYPHGL